MSFRPRFDLTINEFEIYIVKLEYMVKILEPYVHVLDIANFIFNIEKIKKVQTLSMLQKKIIIPKR